MKRWILFAGIVLLGAASVVVSERRKVDVPPSPAPLLYLIADTEQELARMPVSFTRMSDEEEIRIGDALARSYGASNQEREKTPEARIVEHYLTRIGEQIARNAHRRLPYKFHYLPNEYMINAFALPGGHVYVGGGLLQVMDSEDELAAILGHEIEHIDHYDCAERVQTEQALRKIPLGPIVALPVEVFEAGYSKDQELEADRDGTRLAVEAGYSASGAIRMFEALARLYSEQEGKAKTPQEEFSQIALQTLEGYFRSHPLPSERIAQIQELIAREGWTARPERDFAVAYIFLTAKAQSTLVVKKYPQAEQLATQSLRSRPDQPRAFQVLALAEFAQANFSGASNAYRRILDLQKASPPEIIAAYAQALAAADRASALTRFQSWAETVEGEKPREVTLCIAGLQLLAGAPEMAHKIEAELNQSVSRDAPQWIGELAWWHYLAGDYASSVDLLSAAKQVRPGDALLNVRLAWALLEVRRYSDALQILQDSTYYEPSLQAEKAMSQAVANWQSQLRDQAMIDFNRALAGQPEWRNPEWVKPLYSPLVVRSIDEMKAEQERRKQRAKAAEVTMIEPDGHLLRKLKSIAKQAGVEGAELLPQDQDLPPTPCTKKASRSTQSAVGLDTRRWRDACLSKGKDGRRISCTACCINRFDAGSSNGVTIPRNDADSSPRDLRVCSRQLESWAKETSFEEVGGFGIDKSACRKWRGLTVCRGKLEVIVEIGTDFTHQQKYRTLRLQV